jgi:hypothetical protein
MNKNLITELSRMKDLLVYKKGRVISEQDNQLQKMDDDYLNSKPTGTPDENHGLRQCNTNYNGPCNIIWDGYIKNYVGEDLWVKKFGKVPDLVGDKDNKPKTKQYEQPATTQRTNYLRPTELIQNVGNKTGVQAFQDWLDEKYSGWHPKYKTLSGDALKGYGKFGPNTSAAWAKYKTEYLKQNPNLSQEAKKITSTTQVDATKQTPQADATQKTAQPEASLTSGKRLASTNAPSPIQNKTPEEYYQELYDKKLITGDPEGQGRLRYRGPELNFDQQNLLTAAMDKMGYEFLRKGNDKRLVYRKK